jgi:hypothetical protein
LYTPKKIFLAPIPAKPITTQASRGAALPPNLADIHTDSEKDAMKSLLPQLKR